MSAYIAAYDVSHPSQRVKVARVLKAYGCRLQLSVFQVDLDAQEIAELKRQVGSLLAKHDRFELVSIDRDTRRTRLRWQSTGPPQPAVVMI